MSHDIFHKICGRCLAKVPLGATACDCGYSFGRDSASSGHTRTGEISNTVSIERQYESYLEARQQQALDRLRAVREECGLDKWTPEQDQEVQQALQALRNARKELNTQRRRTADAEKEAVLKRVRRGLRTATLRSDSSALHNAESARTAGHTVSSVRGGRAPAIPSTRSKPTAGDITATKVDTPGPPNTKPPERVSTTAPSQTPALKHAATRTRSLPVEQPSVVTPAKHVRSRQADPVRHLPENDGKPTPTAVKTADMPSTIGFPAPPRDTFRAAQPAKTARIRPGQGNAQQCPHCTAELPAQAQRCGCGYEFPNISLFPALELTTEDYTIAGIVGGFPRRA